MHSLEAQTVPVKLEGYLRILLRANNSVVIVMELALFHKRLTSYFHMSGSCILENKSLYESGIQIIDVVHYYCDV
jgi:hypothetical protein